MSKEVKPRKKTNGYKFPEPIPKNEILQDTSKIQWKLGPSIGSGGFGEVYSATKCDTKKSDYSYVIKIEPRENGPLYVETHCYLRIAKPEKIDEWIKDKKLNYLGMPRLLGFGSHEYQKENYRFIVMERYGKCIGTLFKENKSFPLNTVLQLSYQIINILEYIHNAGYVHGDIKGDNLLLGLNKNSENQVHLVDFGLASKHSLKSDFKPDPKKAHNGTIEYTSRDAHLGVSTIRGDLETLAFNIIHWLSSTLPWINNKPNNTVQKKKEENMEKIPQFMKTCFGNVKPPNFLSKFLNYIMSLKFNSTPDYDYCRKLFKDELTKNKSKINSPMQFKENKKKSNKRKSESENEEDEDNEEYFSDSEPEKSKPKRRIGRTVRKMESKTKSDESLSPKPKIKKLNNKPTDSPKFMKSLALKNSYVVRHPDILNGEKK